MSVYVCFLSVDLIIKDVKKITQYSSQICTTAMGGEE
jgi:hypothetical protein